MRCWGAGSNGQLGYGEGSDIGDDESPASAGDVEVGGVVSQIAAGNSHTCALLESGDVRCWGTGPALGYGEAVISVGAADTPASAGSVQIGGAVKQLAAGGGHTCALLTNGKVRCWGEGVWGALGYGNDDDVGSGAPFDYPMYAGDVNVGGEVVQITAGNAHTCALLKGGSVRCWGLSSFGRLGYGQTEWSSTDTVPADTGDVNVGGAVVQIAAGGEHTCALLDGGSVRCWGRNSSGQLGYGHSDPIGDVVLPANAGDVNVGGDVVQLTAGSEHTCALLKEGNVRCWGSPSDGRLAYGASGYIGDDEDPAAAGDVPVGGVVTQVAAGDKHTCALLVTGGVRCWGDGENGRLGHMTDGTIGIVDTPADWGDVPYL